MTGPGLMDELDEAWLSRRHHDDLPAEAERALRMAGAHYADTDTALAHLRHAAELAPNHPAVDLGFYKFHFYKHDLTAAAAQADIMIGHALKALHLHNRDWRDLTVEDAAFDAIEAGPRFLLFALVARGYLACRLGEMETGLEYLTKVASLDPADRLGAKRLITTIQTGLADRLAEEAAA